MLNRFPKSKLLLADDDKNLLLKLKRTLKRKIMFLKMLQMGKTRYQKLMILVQMRSF